MLFIELIAQGLVQGSIYALIALGLTLVVVAGEMDDAAIGEWRSLHGAFGLG